MARARAGARTGGDDCYYFISNALKRYRSLLTPACHAMLRGFKEGKGKQCED